MTRRTPPTDLNEIVELLRFAEPLPPGGTAAELIEKAAIDRHTARCLERELPQGELDARQATIARLILRAIERLRQSARALGSLLARLVRFIRAFVGLPVVPPRFARVLRRADVPRPRALLFALVERDGLAPPRPPLR